MKGIVMHVIRIQECNTNCGLLEGIGAALFGCPSHKCQRKPIFGHQCLFNISHPSWSCHGFVNIYEIGMVGWNHFMANKTNWFRGDRRKRPGHAWDNLAMRASKLTTIWHIRGYCASLVWSNTTSRNDGGIYTIFIYDKNDGFFSPTTFWKSCVIFESKKHTFWRIKVFLFLLFVTVTFHITIFVFQNIFSNKKISWGGSFNKRLTVSLISYHYS